METQEYEIIYPQKKGMYHRMIDSLKRDNKVSAKNKELIIQFQENLLSTTAKERRASKLIGQLRKIAKGLKSDTRIKIR